MDAAVTLSVLLVGLSAGLRTFTPPAVIAWAAFAGWIKLDATPVAFMSSAIAVAVFSFLALAEFVYDILPKTPPRTEIRGLIARFFSGSFCAACLIATLGQSYALFIIGGVATLGGAFAGYEARTRCVRNLKVGDRYIAIPEDAVAIALSVAAIYLAAG